MELVRQTADISSTEGANQCGVVSVLLNETTPQTLEGNDWSSLSPPSIQSGGKSLRSNAGRRSCLIRNSSASVSVNHEFLGDVDATVKPALPASCPIRSTVPGFPTALERSSIRRRICPSTEFLSVLAAATMLKISNTASACH